MQASRIHITPLDPGVWMLPGRAFCSSTLDTLSCLVDERQNSTGSFHIRLCVSQAQRGWKQSAAFGVKDFLL